MQQTITYRLIVIGSMLSSFLVGLHAPMFHDILEHGATPRWDVVAVTLLLAVQIVQASRDPRDDQFLEVAVNGAADIVVTGDSALLVLDPFREIAILTPIEYLKAAQQR